MNGCSLLSENITIDQPLEIIVEAGEDIVISECGISRVQLNAIPVDPELGSGRWEIISPANVSNAFFQDPLVPTTWFSGQANENYQLAWVVTPIIAECPEIIDTIEVNLPEACSKLNFDGIDDYVDAGDHYSMGGSDFSIEAWVKPNSISGVKTILSKRIEGEPNLGYDLILNNGSPSFRVRNRSVTATQKVATNRWYHIAGVYTSSKITLYVDGIEVQNNTNQIPNGSGSLNTPFMVGASPSSNSPKLTKDHFNGFIEEVRIWNTPIPIEQIRFFMNQRLMKDSSNKVSGTVLSNDLNLPNAPAKLDWTILQGYYPLLAKENLISSGYTQNLGDLGTNANGLLKNIQLMQENTAPLPYILYSDNNEWYSRSTWNISSNYDGLSSDYRYQDVWDAPNSNGINGDKIDWNIVKLDGNSVKNTATNNNSKRIELLGLLDDGGKLTMEGAPDQTGNELFISHYLYLDGIIDLNGTSQLVQPEGSILEKNSAGFLEIDQQGTANSYNYNYWTSPVSNVTPSRINSGYSLATVLYNGSKPFTFNSGFSAADNPTEVLLSSYWLYSFSGNANDYFTWRKFDENSILDPGIGFSMKGTSGAAELSKTQTYTFKGLPNNGDITVDVGANQNLLTGNPYPSAIDSEKFIDDNAITRQNFNGSLYFWDHFSKEDTHYLEEYVGGYAVLNKSGSVSSASSIDPRINTDTDLKGTKRPGRYIPVGQGFFISTTRVNNPDAIKFQNSQRVYVKEETGSSVFHIQENIPSKNNDKDYQYSKENRQKIRLKLKSPKGYRRQILVTADINTTTGFDIGYDAPLLDNNLEDLYWMIDETRFVIQGVPDFNKDRVLPIGFKIAEPGEYIMEVEELENIDDNFEIYLYDTFTDEYFDLIKSNHTVQTDTTGTFNTKYQLVFQKRITEEVEETEEEEEIIDELPITEEQKDSEFLDMRYLGQTDEIALYNPDLQNIDLLEIYSVSGQKIMTFDDVPTEVSVNLRIQQKLSSAVYVVKIYVGEKSYTKKVIITK